MRKDYLKYYYWVFTIFFLLLFLIVLIANVPSPIKLKSKNHLVTLSAFPQGWSFFTRDPLEDKYLIYDSNFEMIPQNYSGKENFYGIKRNVRSEGREIAVMFSKIHDSIWKKVSYKRCERPDTDSLTLAILENDIPFSSLKGSYLFEIRPLVAYEWRENECMKIQSKICKVKIVSK